MYGEWSRTVTFTDQDFFTYWWCHHRHSCGSWCHWPQETSCSCCPHTSWRTRHWSHLPLGIHRRDSTQWTWAGWRMKVPRLGTERKLPSGAPESSPSASAVDETQRNSLKRFCQWSIHLTGYIWCDDMSMCQSISVKSNLSASFILSHNPNLSFLDMAAITEQFYCL